MKLEKRDPLTEKIIGACIEVHKHLGPGLFESTYQHLVGWELKQAGLAFEMEKQVPVFYKGMAFGLGYRADIVVEDRVVLELKVQPLTRLCEAQLMTYLKLLNKPVGLFINFNQLFLSDGIKRIANEVYASHYGVG